FREAWAGGLARARLLLRLALHHRGEPDLGLRRRLPLRGGALHRADVAHRLRRFATTYASTMRGVTADGPGPAAIPDEELHRARHPGCGARSAGAATAGRRANPHQADGVPRLHGHP